MVASCMVPMPGPSAPTHASGSPATEAIAAPQKDELATPIDASYAARVTSSRTQPGAFARQLFERPRSLEPLVSTEAYGIAGKAYYAISDGSNPPYRMRLAGSDPTIYVRQSVALKLQEVNRILAPYGYQLYVRDGWRSIETQRSIFHFFEKQYLQQHPDASPDQARQHALRFASDPNVAVGDPETVPLHATGGAVDVTLMPLHGHEPLDLGTPFDDTTNRAHTAYFETHEPATAEDANNRDLRRLLTNAMQKAGFTNYPNEWWHYDYGDRMYALIHDIQGRPIPSDVAPYSYIVPSAQQTQAIAA